MGASETKPVITIGAAAIARKSVSGQETLGRVWARIGFCRPCSVAPGFGAVSCVTPPPLLGAECRLFVELIGATVLN